MAAPFRGCVRLFVFAAVTASVLVGAASAASAGGPLRLGPFAGYIWRSGPVSQVSATFTVPRIDSGSPANAFAGTWIGAQAPGVNGPFIQIGVNEKRVDISSQRVHRIEYYAFWSDTRLHFHPAPLFSVLPGDRIAASLQLVHGAWKLAIADANTDISRRFSTSDEASGAFDLGEFLQEDVSHGPDRVPFPYPRLSGVQFSQLRVDWQTPGPGKLLSQWMTMQRGDLAPAPLRRDAFSVHPARLGAAATRYRRLAAPDDSATNAFNASQERWSATTPRAQIAAASATFAAAIRSNLRLLARPAWPPRLRPYAAALTARQLALLLLIRATPRQARADLRAWRRAYRRAGNAITNAALAFKAQMHGPQLVA